MWIDTASEMFTGRHLQAPGTWRRDCAFSPGLGHRARSPNRPGLARSRSMEKGPEPWNFLRPSTWFKGICTTPCGKRPIFLVLKGWYHRLRWRKDLAPEVAVTILPLIRPVAQGKTGQASLVKNERDCWGCFFVGAVPSNGRSERWWSGGSCVFPGGLGFRGQGLAGWRPVVTRSGAGGFISLLSFIIARFTGEPLGDQLRVASSAFVWSAVLPVPLMYATTIALMGTSDLRKRLGQSIERRK